MSDVLTLKVEGMTWGHCKASVEKAISSMQGVSSVAVDLGKKTVTVGYDPDKVNPSDMEQAITEEGYEVVGIA